MGPVAERYTFAITDSKLVGRTLSGTAHQYGQETQDSRKIRFAPGAFADSLRRGQVVSFAHHDMSRPLASMAAGTLQLEDGPDKLRFSLELPEGVSYAEDIRKLAENGFPFGMSFGIGKPEVEERLKGGVLFIRQAPLLSVDPVSLPAFAGTDVQLHSLEQIEDARSTAAKIRDRIYRRNA